MWEPEEIAGSVIGLVIVVVITFMFGYEVGNDTNARAHAIRVEAVQNGFAEWLTDAEGNTEFSWIERVGPE